jgi:uncharacterized membrane protein YraQ (UPF0718 family)
MAVRRSPVIDGALLFLLALLGVLGALAWWLGGSGQLLEGLRGGGALLLRFAPVLLVSFLAAGLIEVLIPREWVSRALGAESGWVGILIGTGAGMITPAGPFVSMPIAAVFLRSGAAPGAVVAFLTAWSLLSLHRFVAWEIPILEPRFAILRYGVSLGLPILAGFATRLLTRT